jgi:hypothetical protein
LSAKPTFASIAAARRLISYAVGTRRVIGRQSHLARPASAEDYRVHSIFWWTHGHFRRSSPELQRLAYEKGLILFIPADRGSRDP